MIRVQVSYLRLPTGGRRGWRGQITGAMGEVTVELDGGLFDAETVELVRATVRQTIGAGAGEQVHVFWTPPPARIGAQATAGISRNN